MCRGDCRRCTSGAASVRPVADIRVTDTQCDVVLQENARTAFTGRAAGATETKTVRARSALYVEHECTSMSCGSR